MISMNVWLYNKSGQSIILGYNNHIYELQPAKEINIEINECETELSLTLKSESTLRTVRRSIADLNFVVKSLYIIRSSLPSVVMEIYAVQISGEHLESYRYVFPMSSQAEIYLRNAVVADEAKIKEQITQTLSAPNNKRRKHINSRTLDSFLTVLDVLVFGTPLAVILFLVAIIHFNGIVAFLSVIFSYLITFAIGKIVDVCFSKLTNKTHSTILEVERNIEEQNIHFDSSYIVSLLMDNGRYKDYF